ncbi:MAG: hypothetical protein QY331_07690 [Melioribacteraceae bacterium]|nr:MAG: hypothetical protein QY331_07690 [Melioribacteraceae bacterium]
MEKAFWLLLGSIITIVITKLFEIFQASKENKFTLRKIYFEKKIIAAEEAITDLYNDLNGISKFMRVYNKIANSKIEDFPFIYKEMEYLNEETKKAIDATDKIAHRMYLYFDFDEYMEKEESNLDALLDLSTELRSAESEIEIIIKVAKDFDKDQGAEEIALNKIKEKFEEYIPKLKELVQLGHRAQKDARMQLKQIKAEMKKYDL